MRKVFAIMDGFESKDFGMEIEKEFEISSDMFEAIVFAKEGINNDFNYSHYYDKPKLKRRKMAQSTINKIKRKAIAPKKRWRVMQRDNFKCVKCGRGVQEVDCLQVDHIIPVSKGGTNDDKNLQTLCWECNVGKFNREENNLSINNEVKE